MGVRSAGTRRRDDGGPRRGRRAVEADALAETAHRRLSRVLGARGEPRAGEWSVGERPAADPAGDDEPAGGWVPQQPAGADPPPAPVAERAWLGSLRDRLPAGAQAVLVAPGGRALASLALVVTVAVAATAATAWLTRPQEQPAPGAARQPSAVGNPLSASAEPLSAPAPTTAAGSPAAAGTVVLVHVAGAVRRPGLVELPPGSRVADAVEAAGGVTRSGNAASVNLARPLVDGEQVVVARRGEAVGPPPVAPSGAASATGVAGAPVDLNTATLEQLDGLPGIGPVLAQRILDWRTANGRFSVVDELGEVSGIGEATLADLRPLVTV